MAKPKKMDLSKLKSLITNEAQQAISYIQEHVSPDRLDALNLYLGNKFGNERDGRSQFVSRDVFETTLWVLPSLLEIFTSSDDVVVAEPVNSDDVKPAEEAAALLNHVFYKENQGFMLLHNWFHDALIMKNGFVKAYYEDNKDVQTEEYPYIPLDAFMLLQQDPSVEEIGRASCRERV